MRDKKICLELEHDQHRQHRRSMVVSSVWPSSSIPDFWTTFFRHQDQHLINCRTQVKLMHQIQTRRTGQPRLETSQLEGLWTLDLVGPDLVPKPNFMVPRRDDG